MVVEGVIVILGLLYRYNMCYVSNTWQTITLQTDPTWGNLFEINNFAYYNLNIKSALIFLNYQFLSTETR